MNNRYLATSVVFWLLDLSVHAAEVFLYPTIIYPRNITMGYGYTVRYECSLSVDEGEVSEMPWYHDENQLTKDSRRTIEMVKVSAGTYRSYLDINHLYEGDIGWYSCSAQVTFNDATLARVVPDRVYLALTDYTAAHWDEPCVSSSLSCVDPNTACFKVEPPSKPSPTSYSCQCLEDFPVYSSELRRCDTGAHLGEECRGNHQCTWFTDLSVCSSGKCQCIDGFLPNSKGTKCAGAISEGHPCEMDWECGESGLECVSGSCQKKAVVTAGQIAVLTLLAVIGFCLVLYLIFLIVQRRRQTQKAKRQSHTAIYIVPMRS